MTTSTRWTLAILALLAALVAGLARHVFADPPPGEADTQPARAHREADTEQALAGPRQQAGLPPCPAPGDGPGPAKLRGLVVECAADGSAVDVGPAVAGRVVLLNLWAYWCGPCAEELPALAQYQQQAGDSVTVLTVHQDENEAAGLLRMAELGVRLPMLQDGRRDIAAALSVPNVMPASVVLRADGSVAAVLPKPFTSADDIAAEVESALR